jgi:hypothetical protein
VEAPLLEQVDRDERRDGRSRTIGELGGRWLEWRQQVRPISPVTVANYRGAIDRYILPNLGRAMLHEVEAATLDTLYARVRAPAASAATAGSASAAASRPCGPACATGPDPALTRRFTSPTAPAADRYQHRRSARSTRCCRVPSSRRWSGLDHPQPGQAGDPAGRRASRGRAARPRRGGPAAHRGDGPEPGAGPVPAPGPVLRLSWLLLVASVALLTLLQVAVAPPSLVGYLTAGATLVWLLGSFAVLSLLYRAQVPGNMPTPDDFVPVQPAGEVSRRGTRPSRLCLPGRRRTARHRGQPGPRPPRSAQAMAGRC